LDLQTLANLAEVFGALTVIGGVGFAIVQLREFRHQRRSAIAAELMRSFYNPELARAVRLIQQLPDGVSAQELRERGPEYEIAAILVSTTYETMGLLVFLEIAPFSMVLELTGGLTVVMWKKLDRWLDELRVEQSQPTWAEWFQWLAERLDEWSREHPSRPAYEEFSGWRPRAETGLSRGLVKR
jgi:hypothetical protein